MTGGERTAQIDRKFDETFSIFDGRMREEQGDDRRTARQRPRRLGRWTRQR